MSLSVRDCRPAGVKLFFNRQEVRVVERGDSVAQLSNGFSFAASDVDALLARAGVEG